jgi:Xaa-Pro aminopeptidase
MRPISASQLLKRAGAPAFIVTNLVNIQYLTGLPVSAGIVVAVPRHLYLFVDSRYREMAERMVGSMTINDVSELHEVMSGIKECGFEAEDVTVHRKGTWKKKFPKTTFVPTVGVVQSFRRQKDDEELPF